MDDLYISKVCQGDAEAFRYFIKEYKDMAFSIAISVVKDEFMAEEIVQDSFLKAFKGLSSFQKRAAFSTWFFRIVTNESFRRLRKIKKEIVSFCGEFEGDVEDEVIYSSLEEEEQTYLINKALEMLDPRESLALRLFYLQEESIKEVGNITGWSVSNTKVILFRARKNMLAVIKQITKSAF